MVRVVRLIGLGSVFLICHATSCFSVSAATFTFKNESWPQRVIVDIRMENDTGKAENNPSVGPPEQIPYGGSYACQSELRGCLVAS